MADNANMSIVGADSSALAELDSLNQQAINTNTSLEPVYNITDTHSASLEPFDSKQFSFSNNVSTLHTSSAIASKDYALSTSSKLHTSSTSSWMITLGGTGSDHGSLVRETTKGSFVFTGRTSSFGVRSEDAILGEIDSNGAFLWSKTFGMTGNDRLDSVQETNNGGYIAVGKIQAAEVEGEDILLIRTDSTGMLIWARAFGRASSDGGYFIQKTGTNDFIITGYSSSLETHRDFLLAKMNLGGELLFAVAFGGLNAEEATFVLETVGGDFIGVGYSRSFVSGESDILLIKTNKLGVLIWAKVFIEPSNGLAQFVQEVAGNFIVIGKIASFGAGRYDLFFSILDSSGNLFLALTFGGTETDEGYAVQEMDDGTLIIAGATSSFGGTNSIFLIKVDNGGILIWAKIIFGKNVDRFSMQKTLDGGFIIAGTTFTSTSIYTRDIVIIKLDANGEIFDCPNTVQTVTALVSVTDITSLLTVTDVTGSITTTDLMGTITETDITGLINVKDILPVIDPVCPVPNSSWMIALGGTSSDHGSFVRETTKGSFVFTGRTSSSEGTGSDVILGEINSNGAFLWAKTFGGIGSDYSNSVQETGDGGFIVVGITHSFGSADILLIRTNSNGRLIWARTFGGPLEDQGYFVQKTGTMDFIITGKTRSFGEISGDIFFARITKEGNLLFAVAFGGLESDIVVFVKDTVGINSVRNFIGVRSSESFGAGDMDILLIKTSTSCTLIWAKVFIGPNDELAKFIQEVAGNFIVIGNTKSFGAGTNDLFFAILDNTGNLLLALTFGGAGEDYGSAVQEMASGELIILGTTSSFGGTNSIFLIKVDNGGTLIWAKIISGGNSETGGSIQKTLDRGFIITGGTRSFGTGGEDIFLVKLDANGEIFDCPNIVQDVTALVTVTDVTSLAHSN